MRSLYFTAAESGLTRSQLRWGDAQGRWTKVARTTYRHGDGPATALDRAIGLVVATKAPASGTVAGTLLGLDAVTEVAGIPARTPSRPCSTSPRPCPTTSGSRRSSRRCGRG